MKLKSSKVGWCLVVLLLLVIVLLTTQKKPDVLPFASWITATKPSFGYQKDGKEVTARIFIGITNIGSRPVEGLVSWYEARDRTYHRLPSPQFQKEERNGHGRMQTSPVPGLPRFQLQPGESTNLDWEIGPDKSLENQPTVCVSLHWYDLAPPLTVAFERGMLLQFADAVDSVGKLNRVPWRWAQSRNWRFISNVPVGEFFRRSYGWTRETWPGLAGMMDSNDNIELSAVWAFEVFSHRAYSDDGRALPIATNNVKSSIKP